MAGRFRELSGSDLNMKTNLVIEWYKTIIELGYRKISWFVSVSQINYRHWKTAIICWTSSNSFLNLLHEIFDTRKINFANFAIWKNVMKLSQNNKARKLGETFYK